MKKNILLTYGCLISVLLTLIGLFYLKPSIKEAKSNNSTFYSGRLIESNFIKKGKVMTEDMLLMFASTDCDYCEKTVQYIEENKKMLFQKFQLVIVFNQNKSDIQSFLQRNIFLNSPKVSIYQDKDLSLSSDMKIVAIPTLYEIKGKQIAHKYQGFDEAKNFIDDNIKRDTH